MRNLHLLPRIIPLVIACEPLLGCTAIILNDASTADLPCEDAADCASGQRCQDEVCVDDERDAEAPGAPEVVGPAGGVLPGPDGLSIEFPPGALETEATFTIERESSTTPLDGLSARSRLFRVTPAMALQAAVFVSIDVEGSCTGCSIYTEDGGAFVALPDAGGNDDVMAGRADSLGVFVAAEEAP